ncbi:hypothetical protein GTA62_16145 [Roseobacter sp. HKCCD9010]|uniref:hypothetical protein n=1 Tax=Rhodobacterales TaxID=204455 RepID=UPI0014908BCB|nr:MULTISPECIES: hypothetical protein [Rhodobacterales]MBF9051724.1 hypothetical protein [Rhodobacterales bacterium HKCCD4356]NNV13248.1 hypothetical protein [Roseobacter sp. HKCCD7357]NNV17499.1 hypothetical protein [Roseobacter sp. HKCCD8768]NNV27105.1 hypothetical protein [Roseobacter sp. HKCCD8192]NNV31225.1 hypothetical protein [Roseobacter sp. HKCCD9061]
MKATLTALALAATLSVGLAPASFAMEAEIDALMEALEGELSSRGIETEGLENLTIAELRLVQQMLANGDSAGEMRRSIDVFVNE